jgi:hypothetical protein
LLRVLEWVGPDAEHEEHLDPSWGLVEDAIRRLNGQERNDLHLYADPDAAVPGAYLPVRGRWDGRYVAVGVASGARSPTYALGPDEDDGRREPLLVGGNVGFYHRDRFIDLDTVLRAARSFYEAGGFGGGGVQWVEW